MTRLDRDLQADSSFGRAAGDKSDRAPTLSRATSYPVEIDHRNGVRNDNRWLNLREATSSQNKFNRKVVNHHRGVHFIARDRKFGAQIRAEGEHHWLGSFLLPEDACRAYRAAAAALHGEFLKPGRCGCP